MVQCFQKDVNNSKKQNSVKNITVDRFATIEQKQICGYIVKQICNFLFNIEIIQILGKMILISASRRRILLTLGE